MGLTALADETIGRLGQAPLTQGVRESDSHAQDSSVRPSFTASARLLQRIARGEGLGPLWWLALCLAPAPLIAVALLQPFEDPRYFFFDPLTAAEVSPECCRIYYGAISTLGVMLWTMCAGICLFAAGLLWITALSPSLARFALYAGLLSGWLALDDVFLIHENVLPAFGIPQNAVLAAYALLGLAYTAMVLRARPLGQNLIYLVAGGFFVVSLGIDVVVHSPATYAIVLEDGAKLFGIWTWTLFHVATIGRALLLDDFR